MMVNNIYRVLDSGDNSQLSRRMQELKNLLKAAKITCENLSRRNANAVAYFSGNIGIGSHTGSDLQSLVHAKNLHNQRPYEVFKYALVGLLLHEIEHLHDYKHGKKWMYHNNHYSLASVECPTEEKTLDLLLLAAKNDEMRKVFSDNNVENLQYLAPNFDYRGEACPGNEALYQKLKSIELSHH